MEKTSEQSVPTPPDQQSVCWYQAATLTERHTSQFAQDSARASRAGSTSQEAEKILQHWKAQKPFDAGSFFLDRLAMDALTEQDLLSLLAEPLEALQERLSHPTAPAWVTEICTALQTDPAPLTLSERERERLFQRFALAQPFYPLLQKSIARLQTSLAALVQQYDALPYDPQNILSLLLPTLFQQIEAQVSKTLVLELHIARLRGHLQGENSEDRFHDYLRLLVQREHLQPLLEEYVVLARHILITSELWAQCSLEFVQRLCADWQSILEVLQPEQEPGVLTQIRGSAGDTHRGGHSVMILTFRSGWQLLYKPKSLTIDVHFQQLLAWLNVRGSHPAFRLLKLIDKITYGWSEFVAASACSSEAEVARFYERQGGYLALLYVLDAADFHYENVIAAGDQPLLIDLEALFHPRPPGREATPRLAQQFLGHSVLRSLLLPARLIINEEGEGFDISGLSPVAGQLSPRPVALWEGMGTDEVKLVRKRIEMQGSHNCPRLNDQEVQPLDYIESLLTGFRAIYRVLLTNQDELLTTLLPCFAHDEVRFVARATRTYATLLMESFHPNMLRDALKRERFFDRLWLAVELQPHLSRLIAAERADLLRGDIPLFTTYPQSRDLWTSQGECLPEFFVESSLEVVRQNLQQLGEEDLQRQIWLIRASFTSLAAQQIPATSPGYFHADADKGSRLLTPASVTRERLLSEARAIGDRVCASALRDGDQTDWFGLTFVREREWQIAPASLDLCSGLPGIILFLSYLGQITEEERYTSLAYTGITTMRSFIKQNKTILEEQGGVGAFHGLSSCLYLFSHLSVLWHDPTLLLETEQFLHWLPDQIEKDEQFDVMDGVAGCLSCLLALYAVTPSDRILKLALQCGDRLLTGVLPMPTGPGWKARQQDVPLAGFSHGSAGIIWSLLRLAAVSGEKRFRDTALAALTYERSLFSPQQRNWLDLRKRFAATVQHNDQAESTQAQEARYGMSWGHGAPGIALGRLISLPYLDDATSHAELEVALDTTITESFGYSHERVGPNHSLLHGDCGNLETVLIAAQMLRTPQLHQHLERLTTQLIESKHQHEWVMGVPLNMETPGLMLGLSGIGYQCLRLAEPEYVPSLLALAPPPMTRC